VLQKIQLIFGEIITIVNKIIGNLAKYTYFGDFIIVRPKLLRLKVFQDYLQRGNASTQPIEFEGANFLSLQSFQSNPRRFCMKGFSRQPLKLFYGHIVKL